jgi:DNA ligase-1
MLDALEQLERVSGLTKKKQVLSKYSKVQEFRDLIESALLFSKKFYVKKFNISEPKSLPLRDSHKKFMDLLNVLSSRILTGNAAINAVEGFLSMCDAKQQKWYSRVLKKDLRCGISVKTVNQTGFNLATFDVMLATDIAKCKKIDEIISEGVYISPKLDGYRCIAIKQGNEVCLYSRNGSLYDNFPEIIEQLKQCEEDFVLDGEIMSDDFQSIQRSAFASTRGTVVGDLEYHVFGFVPMEEWESGNFEIDTYNRNNMLNSFMETYNHLDKIKKVPQELVYDIEDIEKLENKYISEGYEGLMVLPNIPYYKGRKANSLMKLKRVETMDATVIGMYEGTGKYVGKMGGITVLQDNDEVCDIGSGFTDEDRDYMWKNRDDIIGRIAEIKYQEMTKDSIMRFPIFIRWRDQGLKSDKI